MLVFYCAKRETGRYLSGQITVTSINYARIFCLGVLDALLTFPLAVANISLQVKSNLATGGMPFYYGWYTVHGPGWDEPYIVTRDVFVSEPASDIALSYVSLWSSVFLGWAIFFLFGLTKGARGYYAQSLQIVFDSMGLGWKISSLHTAWSQTRDLETRDGQEISLQLSARQVTKCSPFHLLSMLIEGSL